MIFLFIFRIASFCPDNFLLALFHMFNSYSSFSCQGSCYLTQKSFLYILPPTYCHTDLSPRCSNSSVYFLSYLITLLGVTDLASCSPNHFPVLVMEPDDILQIDVTMRLNSSQWSKARYKLCCYQTWPSSRTWSFILCFLSGTISKDLEEEKSTREEELGPPSTVFRNTPHPH